MEERILTEAIIEYQKLEHQTARLRERIKQYPVGTLKINHKNGSVQYYRVLCRADTAGEEDSVARGDKNTAGEEDSAAREDKNTAGEEDSAAGNEKIDARKPKDSSGNEVRYIRKKERKTAYLLAQKCYDLKLLKELNIRKDALEKMIEAYRETNPFDIWQRCGEERRRLVQTDYVPDELFAERWQAEEYQHKAFASGTPEIITAKGERVRSKSEKIIADTLERFGVPYRYEYPFELEDGRVIHPDFMLLNRRTRKELFLEHLGMMDNPEYCANALKRLEEMGMAGILPGKNLLITAESSQHPLNIKMLNMIIQEYLL